MISVSQAIACTTARLEQAGIASAVGEARSLVSFATQSPPSQLALIEGLTCGQQTTLESSLRARLSGTPLQHITGRAYFRTVSVSVGPGVFIPRPETEVLTGWAINQLKHKQGSRRVVELCAGSGAISLAIATEVDNCEQWAVELSPTAYQYLLSNLTDSAVTSVLADMGDALEELNATIDLVIANPPYISEAQRGILPADVYHDPVEALFSGTQGLEAITVVARVAARLLKPAGVLGCEHGETQSDAVSRILNQAGFIDIHDWTDLNNQPRFATATKPGTRSTD